MTETEQRKKLHDIGISRAYASEIVSGSRKPSLKLAVRIYDETGLKFGALTNAKRNRIIEARNMVAESTQ